MARIQTTFGFRDEISSQLKMVINALNTLNQTTSAVREQMNGATAAIRQAGESARKAEGGFSGLTKKLFNANQIMSFYRNIKGAVGGVMSEFNGLTAAYQNQTNAEARLTQVMGARMKANAESVADMKKFISDFSQGSIYSKTMLTNAAQELGTYIESAKTLKGLLPALTTIAAQSNVTSEQGLMQYATMLGKVMAGDMTGISKRGWTFTEAEKSAYKTMSEEQRLNFLIETAIGGIGRQDKALAELFGNLKQQRDLEEMQQKLGGMLNPLMDAISSLQMKLKMNFYDNMVRGLEWVKTHVQEVSKAITMLGAVAAGVAVAMAVSWAVANWPLLLVAGIIALIISAVMEMGATTEQVGSVVGGVFGALYARIYNGFFVPFYNGFAMLAEFVVNVFNHPLAAVKQLFTNMALDILNRIETILDMARKIPFLNDKVAGWGDAIREAKASVNAWNNRDKPDDMFEIEKKNYIDTVEMVQRGAKIGSGYAGEIERIVNSLNISPSKIAEGIEGAFDFNGSGALKTADSGILDIAEDYRELLSQTATRRFTANFRNVAPEIHLGGIVINENADADKVIDMVTEAVENLSGSDLEAS